MRDKSELERGMESLGRAFTGITGRLLGPKAIGRAELPVEAAISPEADEALERGAADLGRFLHAAGEGLKAHPLDPAAAARTARAHAEDTLTPEEGWSPLAAGLVTLGGGLSKVAEGVLDQVAPRKPKPPAEDDGVDAETAEAPTPGDPT